MLNIQFFSFIVLDVRYISQFIFKINKKKIVESNLVVRISRINN